MTELIIGKTYRMTDVRSYKKYVFKILNKVKNDNKIYYIVIGTYNISYTIDISLYINIEEIQEDTINTPSHYGGDDNPHEPRKIIKHYKLTPNLANVIKYVLRAGVKFPTLQGKIDDLQKAINYIRFEIEDLVEERRIDMSHEIQFDDDWKDNEYDATLRLE